MPRHGDFSIKMEFDIKFNTGEKHLITLAMKSKRPILGSLELTPLCNMDCAMCFVRLSRKEQEAKGRLRTAEEWLALGRQMAESGVLFLQITGGEPLTYPGFKELYIGLREMGIILTLNTNGTLINEEWADFFAAHRPRRINISLYGTDEKAYTDLCYFPGGFSRAMDGIRLLRERNIDVKLNAPQTVVNQNEMDGYEAICEDLGTAIHSDDYIFPAKRERSTSFEENSRPSPEESAAVRLAQLRRMQGDAFYANLVRELEYIDSLPEKPVNPREMSCLAAKAAFIVNWQGMLRPCIMMNEPEVPVFDIGFEEGWSRIRRETDKILLPEPCGSCRLRSICGICAAAGILEKKDESGAPIYVCRATRELERLMRLEAEKETAVQ